MSVSVDHLLQQKRALHCPPHCGILNHWTYDYAHWQGDNQPLFLLPVLDVFLINKFKPSFNDFIRYIGDLPKKKRGCNSLPLRCQDIWKEVKPSNDSVYGIFTQAFLCRYENLFVSGSLFIKIKKLFSYILFLKLNWLALHPLNLHSHNPREMRSLIYFWE